MDEYWERGEKERKEKQIEKERERERGVLWQHWPQCATGPHHGSVVLKSVQCDGVLLQHWPQCAVTEPYQRSSLFLLQHWPQHATGPITVWSCLVWQKGVLAALTSSHNRAPSQVGHLWFRGKGSCHKTDLSVQKGPFAVRSSLVCREGVLWQHWPQRATGHHCRSVLFRLAGRGPVAALTLARNKAQS